MKVSVATAVVLGVLSGPHARAIQVPEVDYRVLATSKTSTMEKEMNQAAEAGFRFQAIMGGETAIAGSEVVAVMSRVTAQKGRYAYRLLATSKTSTMERELQQASEQGFDYRGQSVFATAFGGDEVVCILERDGDATRQAWQYKLLAVSKTSTLEKELRSAAASGYELLGLTVSKTSFGGTELVAITRRLKP